MSISDLVVLILRLSTKETTVMITDTKKITELCPSVSMNRNGFTIVELMIVVAIVGVLAAIAIPAYNNYVTTGKQAGARGIIDQLPVLIETYRAENGEMCPACTANGTYTYSYTENAAGAENTPGANRITNIYPNFQAKGIGSSTASLYHYQVAITVAGCPNCTESAVVTALPQAGRGAPPGNIVSQPFQ